MALEKLARFHERKEFNSRATRHASDPDRNQAPLHFKKTNPYVYVHMYAST